MTKAAAMQSFFEKLGIGVYTSAAVPEDAEYPRLTYDFTSGNWYTEATSVTVNLWDYSTSEVNINAKAQELLELVSPCAVVQCDGGGFILRPGTPWSQSIADDSEPRVKRRYINIMIEYITKR